MSFPTLDDALQDVEARFLNLPESELNQPQRLFFQIEQAYWYYEDFKADRFPHLPHFSNLKSFASKIFSHCEILSNMIDRFKELFADFASYKSKIPVCGCIMLNPSMTKMVLVCNWKGDCWSFPRGKIDEGELELDCAVREVEEETGFNARDHCNEQDYVVTFQDQKKIQLFIATNVPESTIFSPQTRKEVSQIQFHPIDKLPPNTYHVHPFVPKLKRWIKQKQKQQSGLLKSPKPTMLTPTKILQQSTPGKTNKQPKTSAGNTTATLTASQAAKKLEALTAVLKMNTPTKILKRPIPGEASITTATTAGTMRVRNEFDLRNTDTFAMDFGSSGEAGQPQLLPGKRWSVEDMFQANKKLTGREYDYDGNPHQFGSSHPRYVNYRPVSTPTAISSATSKTATTTLSSASSSASTAMISTTPSTDLAFLEFSKQSYQLGGRLLRGKEYSFDSLQSSIDHDPSITRMIPEAGRSGRSHPDEEGLDDSFALPASVTQQQQQLQEQSEYRNMMMTQEERRRVRGSFFPTSIPLNVTEIMFAMDECLRLHPVVL